MQYKKRTLQEYGADLARLRESGKRPFDSYLDPSRIQFDLSVLPQYRGVLKPVSVSGLEAKA